MFKKRQEKRDEFMAQIRNIYNNDDLQLSDNLKEALVKCAQGIENRDRISYLAYHLYPNVIGELRRDDLKQSAELFEFKKYLEKKKWYYTIGAVTLTR